MPPVMKRSIAVYEAARVLIGYITPRYDEISQVCFPVYENWRPKLRLLNCCTQMRASNCMLQ